LQILYAYLLSLRHEHSLALQFVQSAKRQLDAIGDLPMEVKILGLEKRICTKLGLSFSDVDQKRLNAITKQFGGHQATRTLARENSTEHLLTPVSEDPIGHLMDTIARNP